MTAVPFPSLETPFSQEPPLPPFHWRLANMGPVMVEFLYDSRGHQVFRGSIAIRGETFPNKTWKPKWVLGGAQ